VFEQAVPSPLAIDAAPTTAAGEEYPDDFEETPPGPLSIDAPASGTKDRGDGNSSSSAIAPLASSGAFAESPTESPNNQPEDAELLVESPTMSPDNRIEFVDESPDKQVESTNKQAESPDKHTGVEGHPCRAGSRDVFDAEQSQGDQHGSLVDKRMIEDDGGTAAAELWGSEGAKGVAANGIDMRRHSDLEDCGMYESDEEDTDFHRSRSIDVTHSLTSAVEGDYEEDFVYGGGSEVEVDDGSDVENLDDRGVMESSAEDSDIKDWLHGTEIR